MKTAKTTFRVRYGETDRMGGVYYANYIAWFELGRSALMREAGCPYSQLEAQGCILPVVETYCKYRYPAHYDDHLTMETWLTRLTKRDLTFYYKIWRDETLLAQGYTRHIPINPQGKRILVPSRVLTLLEPYLASTGV